MVIKHSFVTPTGINPGMVLRGPEDADIWNADHVGPTGRSATFIVAASDASAISISQADYVCDGTDDHVQILAALAALTASGGVVQLTEGNFNCDSFSINLGTVRGMGGTPELVTHLTNLGTVINLNDSSAEITIGQDGRLQDLVVTVINGYTGTAVTVEGESTFTSRVGVLHNVIIEQAGWAAATPTGTALLLNSGAGTTLSHCSFGLVIINGFEYGFLATSASELSGNSFQSLVVQRSKYMVTLDSSAGGVIASNNFAFVLFDAVTGTVDGITLTKGGGTNAENKFLSVQAVRWGLATGDPLKIAAGIYRTYLMGYVPAYVDNGLGNIIINTVNAENSGNSTGTGGEQTIAHGLNGTPTRVILWDIENGALPYQSSPADGINIYVTAVNNQDWGWEAKVR